MRRIRWGRAVFVTLGFSVAVGACGFVLLLSFPAQWIAVLAVMLLIAILGGTVVGQVAMHWCTTPHLDRDQR